MKKFKTLDLLVQAMKRNDFPSHVVSPRTAATALGVSRQSVHALVKRGSLLAWGSKRIIFIDADQVQARAHKKAGVLPGQGALF